MWSSSYQSAHRYVDCCLNFICKVLPNGGKLFFNLPRSTNNEMLAKISEYNKDLSQLNTGIHLKFLSGDPLLYTQTRQGIGSVIQIIN